MKDITALNRKLGYHMDIGVRVHYNLATKLADRTRVYTTVETRVKADKRLVSDMLGAVYTEPLFFSDHKLIDLQSRCLNNAHSVGRGFDEARKEELQAQLLYGRPLTAQEVEDLVHKHVTLKYGDLYVLVTSGEAVWEPKFRWPYIRYVRHCNGANFRDIAAVRRKLGDENYAAEDKYALFERYGKYVNARGYASGQTLDQLF